MVVHAPFLSKLAAELPNHHSRLPQTSHVLLGTATVARPDRCSQQDPESDAHLHVFRCTGTADCIKLPSPGILICSDRLDPVSLMHQSLPLGCVLAFS